MKEGEDIVVLSEGDGSHNCNEGMGYEGVLLYRSRWSHDIIIVPSLHH